MRKILRPLILSLLLVTPHLAHAAAADANFYRGKALGLPIQLTEGFKGTANIRVAAEADEIDGGCWTWGRFVQPGRMA